MGQLIERGKHFFLSRPWRFGKSLLRDTLKELFEGSEELFRGLAIHDRWDRSVRRPVVWLSFRKGDFNEPGYVKKSATSRRWRRPLRSRATSPALPARLPKSARWCAAQPGPGWANAHGLIPMLARKPHGGAHSAIFGLGGCHAHK